MHSKVLQCQSALQKVEAHLFTAATNHIVQSNGALLRSSYYMLEQLGPKFRCLVFLLPNHFIYTAQLKISQQIYNLI